VLGRPCNSGLDGWQSGDVRIILLIRLFFVEESLRMNADHEVLTLPKLRPFLYAISVFDWGIK
jgi:hypothetical protein